MAKIPVVDNLIEKNLHGLSVHYGRLVMKVYLRITLLVFGKASPFLIRGLYRAITGNKEKRIKEFLEGTKVWAEDVKKITKSTVLVLNEFTVPEKGHMIFLNHVNEMDFPYDCYVIRKPFLANQVIKKAWFAYWWMTAMGSQVFDNSKAMSIAVSVKNLIEGLKTTSYIVYPEGKNTYSEEIQPLKKGMVKIAFDQKIPVFVAVKSGVTTYQEYQKGNVVGYLGLGVHNPNEFANWEEFQTHLYQLMHSKKQELDGMLEKERIKLQTV
ncbi:acyltransferase [Leptospira yanagawae serovar Saopaulo str. Sao Paulo = ATCC 700523]|uniref:Acyltransferase n=1 Tax=Leptospira yanagawae serovar Saopaulo str. Sao Paulo = ATCC 700523 TaxID=1249483 RepID=A0A5E8HFT1_9LEPT|nr:acyltransferase [Leptospira yanagawae serovar Saopaulo str. Sao Paulo = ATCC 700523]